MSDFSAALSVFVVLIMLLLVALHFVFLMDIVFGGHDFSTSGVGVRQVAQILTSLKKEDGVLYDLGSARGNFVIRLLKKCPNLKARGVDNSRLRIFYSRLQTWMFSRRAKFILGDIFAANVSSADTVYIYLDKSLMPALQKKLQAELRSGAVVITNTNSLPNWPLLESYVTHPQKPAYEKMFVYQKA